MSDLVVVALILALGYLVGSFPSGLVVARIYRRIDLRRTGSGSTGATNALRAAGVGAAGVVVLMDAVKGAIAALVGTSLTGLVAGVQGAGAIAGLGAVIGHCWPLYVLRGGGRGVATGFGVLTVIAPGVAAVSVTALIVVMLLTRYVSLGSLAAVLAAPVTYTLLIATGHAAFDAAILVFIVGAGSAVLVRHRGNITRLLARSEPRLRA